MNEARISFEGNIGTEPEIKFLANGQGVCEFSVAVNQRKKVGDEWKDVNTTWYRVSVWGKLAESAVEMKKGSRVLVVGTLIGEAWEKDGKSGFSLRVTPEQVAPSLVFTKTAHRQDSQEDPWATKPQQSNDDAPPF